MAWHGERQRHSEVARGRKGKIRNPKSVLVVGKRWFDRINGNTYHSVSVYVNGRFLDEEPFEYGYGDAYQQTALDLLHKHGMFKEYSALWQIKNLGVNYAYEVADVSRKKDL